METSRPVMDEQQAGLSEFIDRLVAEVEPLHLAYNEAVWLANITGEPRYEQESARLDTQIRRVLARQEPYRYLHRLLEQGGVENPLLQRQLEILHNDHLAQQIPPDSIERIVKLEKGLESRFNNFRAELDGERVSDNGIREILRDSDDDPLRRRAWEASKQIGQEVAGNLLELVALRNQAARDIGFANYYALMLKIEELEELWLFGLLDEVERGTRSLFEEMKQDMDARLAQRFRVVVADLRPWHYADPFFQELPAPEIDLDRFFRDQSLETLTDRFFGAIGFEVRDVLERSDLYEKPGKSQHAFCLCLDRVQDVRVLCNNRPTEFWMGTMLHEFGHAVYDKYIDRDLPWVLRGPAHILSTEASAMLFGRLSKNAAWLSSYAGVPAQEAREAAEILQRGIRLQLLVQARWELVMCHMEREIYRDPDQDLNRLWWDLVERYQMVRRPEGRDAPDWASKIHFSVAPVYYHNYLLGEIMASQLQRHLLRDVLGGGADVWQRYVTSPKVGAFLKQRLYASGRRMDWRTTLEHATGETLSPAAFIDELAGRA